MTPKTKDHQDQHHRHSESEERVFCFSSQAVDIHLTLQLVFGQNKTRQDRTTQDDTKTARHAMENRANSKARERPTKNMTDETNETNEIKRDKETMERQERD
jgi:hypothetical protein